MSSPNTPDRFNEEKATFTVRGTDAPDLEAGVAAIRNVLATLPTRQRQVVVLRYFDDLSVNEVATIMNSSTGTVKSQSAKGLAKLRATVDNRPADHADGQCDGGTFFLGDHR